MTNRELARIVLRLRHAFREFLIPRLGLDDRELRVAILKHIVRGERLATPAVPLDTAERDRKLTSNAAAVDNAPAGRLRRGINVVGACLGLVHGFFFCRFGAALGNFITACSKSASTARGAAAVSALNLSNSISALVCAISCEMCPA